MRGNNSESNNVTIVINCLVYNHEPYLKDCLEGIAMQKTNFKFVAVVHDDASTDKSVNIIKEYENKYPDIFIPLYEDENLYSKNKIKLSKKIYDELFKTGAEYIAICEGDDYWIDPLKLQKQYDYMKSHPDCSLCGTNGFVMWEDFIKPAYYFNTISVPKDFSLSDLSNRWQMPTASLLYKVEVLRCLEEWNDGYFHGDLRVMLTAKSMGSVHYLPILTCVYRYSNKNLTSTTNLVGHNLGWAAKEMLRLFNGFDKWTDGKYSDQIEEKKKAISVEIKFYGYYGKSRLLAAIMMPSYFLKLSKRYLIAKVAMMYNR